jgi:hypothetical protein
VTPSSPEAIALDQTSLLVVWTAGAAQAPRFHARRVVLPETASGSIVVVEDPTPPPGQVLIPRSLALIRGSTTAARLLWSDAREGWELVYHLTTDAEGNAIGLPVFVEQAEGTATQAFPDVVQLPDHSGAVIWEDFRSGSLGVFGSFINAEGQPEGGSFRISDTSGGSASAPADNFRDLLRNRPAIAAMRDGSLVVAWTTFVSSRTRVVYQVYDPTGVPVAGNTFVEALCGSGVQANPAVASTRDGGTSWWDTCNSAAGIFSPTTSSRTAQRTATPSTSRIAPTVEPRRSILPFHPARGARR